MDASLKAGKRADLLLAAMTLEGKVGQMTQAERGAVTDDPTLVTTWRLGRCCRAAARCRRPTPRDVERIAHVTAEETRATGPHWVFAPCDCVARDLRWGRTYESYSEDPGLVIKMETAIDGLQGPHACELDEPDRTLATAKHYAGDGDTEYGTGSGDYPIDQGITVTSRRGTRSPTGGTWARSARRRTGRWPGGPSAPRRSC